MLDIKHSAFVRSLYIIDHFCRSQGPMLCWRLGTATLRLRPGPEMRIVARLFFPKQFRMIVAQIFFGSDEEEAA
jgi:hypothetical protein